MRRIRRNSAAYFLNVLTNDAAFASSKGQLQGGGRSGVLEIRRRSISTPQGKIFLSACSFFWNCFVFLGYRFSVEVYDLLNFDGVSGCPQQKL